MPWRGRADAASAGLAPTECVGVDMTRCVRQGFDALDRGQRQRAESLWQDVCARDPLQCPQIALALARHVTDARRDFDRQVAGIITRLLAQCDHGVQACVSVGTRGVDTEQRALAANRYFQILCRDEPGACLLAAQSLQLRGEAGALVMAFTARLACVDAAGAPGACVKLATRLDVAGQPRATVAIDKAACDRDRVVAECLWTEACRDNDAKSCTRAGQVADSAGDAQTALRHYRTACELGDAVGCHAVSRAYQTGTTTWKNEERARRFLQRACDLGLASACSSPLLAK